MLKNDIKVVVNDKEIKADNFVYNDTTYLPLRAVGEALGKNITYDENTNTAYIQEEPKEMNNNYDDVVYKLQANDGLDALLIDGKHCVLTEYIYDKYKGNYFFTRKDDGTYCIDGVVVNGKCDIYFDTYPQDKFGDPDVEWYNEVLLPWILREGWND